MKTHESNNCNKQLSNDLKIKTNKALHFVRLVQFFNLKSLIKYSSKIAKFKTYVF